MPVICPDKNRLLPVAYVQTKVRLFSVSTGKGYPFPVAYVQIRLRLLTETRVSLLVLQIGRSVSQPTHSVA